MNKLSKKLYGACLASLALFLISSFVPVTGFSLDKNVLDSYCQDPNYTCVTIKKHQSWQSLFPDEQQRDLVKRLNRTNQPLWAGMKIIVPKDLDQAELLEYAPFPDEIQSNGQKIIVVDLSQLAWGAYDVEGQLVNWGAVSGGKNWCADVNSSCRTVRGEFEVYSKRGAGCKSKKFPVGKGGAPMPYCMFFHGGYALHGSPSVPGHHASHGCVRLFTEDAKWLHEKFVDLPSSGGTTVIVKDY